MTPIFASKQLDWASTIGVFLINYGVLDWHTLVFLESRLDPKQFAKVKELHLGVYPPNGRVRVAAPLMVSDEAVRLAVVGKLGWIKRQQARFESQPRQSRREMVSGESHYFLGNRFRLRVVDQEESGKVVMRNKSTLELRVRPDATRTERERVLRDWCRLQLKQLVFALIGKWEKQLKVEVAEWRIRTMKTRWGSCNAKARRIWLNLELIKKPVECVEYVLVHELTHFFERNHNDRFVARMDAALPTWRNCRAMLNAEPLAHENWGY